MLILLLISSNGFSWASTAAGLDKFTYLPLAAVQPPPTRKINIPDFGADAVADQHFSEMSIFWFGRISPSDNYADVRIGYNNTGLALILSIFDRLLWYDTSPANADLARWDAVTLYLSQNGSLNNAYRFTVQISSDAEQNRTRWQLAERWVSSAWTVQSISFEASTGLRWQDYTSGGLNNNQNNRGWVTAFNIPFTSLGLAGKPPQGAEWKMALALHDRDDANGTVILESSWPENAQFTQPGSWGGLHFGLPVFQPPSGSPAGTTVIRNKISSDVVVPDAAVGGTTGNLCPGDPDYIWQDFPNENYGASADFNIQNQSDLADWPCFAKYYVTFPLNSLPENKIILNATLTLYHWGNSGALSGPNQAQPSYIQVSTFTQSWSDSTLTWNNAPLAFENVAQAWVNPAPVCGSGGLAWPCTPRTWDVTRAVTEMVRAGKPLNLVLYSSDDPYHSGKFFTTSDTPDWNATGRPTLTITWKNP
jgi:hypothetical protein